ncbi:hypothetical protein FACS1894204_12210 [Synergistales bacterium]|nr:hypothetical protein FACS1894204_12210 [Synergistales bacterium]
MAEDIVKRSDIDDIGRRNNNKDSYKNRVFNGARTTQDEYTGGTVFYSKNGANSNVLDKRIERHYTPETTSNVDHVQPLARLEEKYKGRLSTEEIKELANQDYNYAVTNERLNKSKGDLSNHEYIVRQIIKGEPENAITTFNMLKSELSGNLAHSANYVATKITGKLKIAPETKKQSKQYPAAL